MSKFFRLIKSFYRLLFPVVVLLIVAIMGSSFWFVHLTASPQYSAYVVTLEEFGRLSSRGAKVTEETWVNQDGTASRGWLLRGDAGKPAVILLHKYGANRSYLLNLGVKLNEVTNFTILIPDLRGHGPNPSVDTSSFGGCEVKDTVSAIKYLKYLRNDGNEKLVGKNIGIYGVELGGLIGLSAAAQDSNVKTVVLESVPLGSDNLLENLVEKRFPYTSIVTSKLAKTGSYLYYSSGCYERKPMCEVAKSIADKDILLLAGMDEPALRKSTVNLSTCFRSQTNVKTFTELNPSGFNINKATVETGESYAQKVIYFMKSTLENND